MNRSIALVVVAVLLVGVAGIAAAGPVGTAVAQDDPVATNETNETGESDETEAANGSDISPGERLSGVIGVQRAEISGEVDSRAFEVGLNRTETPEERADLVAERLNRTEARLDEIERRQAALRERREAGELSSGAFAARMAETGARAESAKREANRSADVARALPESVRADRGLNEERLSELRERASEASGPEVAAMARGVAGPGVGRPLASERRGPPANRGAGGGQDDGGSGPSDRSSGPSDLGNGTNASSVSTNASGNLTDASGNASDRAGGGNGSGPRDGGDGGAATPGGTGPSSPAGSGDRGAGSASGTAAEDAAAGDGVGSVDIVASRLTDPLTTGADFVWRVVVGIDG